MKGREVWDIRPGREKIIKSTTEVVAREMKKRREMRTVTVRE
jgi:hypothetical protein